MERRLRSAEEKLKEQQRELEVKSAEAATDSLTLLPNRRRFNDEIARRFAEYKRSRRPLSVLFVDVDHFKQFNDSHGHQVGDEVLRCVANSLRDSVRTMDLLARTGGEEFAAVLPNTPSVAAVAVAERARQAIQQLEIRYEGKIYQVTVSVGLAELRSSEQIAIFLRRADEALYAAKKNGRNCTYYHSEREILPASDAQARRAAPNRQGRLSPDARSVQKPAKQSVNGKKPAALPADQELSDEICDRSAYCHAIRSRLGEWKRGGEPFVVAITKCKCGNQVIGSQHPPHATIMRKVGTQLVSALREMDVVGAYSASSFALLLPKTTRADAVGVAERLCRCVSECSFNGSDPLRLSVGLSEVMDGDDLVRVLERADASLAHAVEAPGSACFFHNGHWPEQVGETAEVAV
jgi:diguanylate cyclase (GGDEF)-like protein